MPDEEKSTANIETEEIEISDRDLTEARTAEDVTPEVADEVVAEIIDLKGRRQITLPDGRTLYVRMPHTGEDEKAELAYSKKLFEVHDRQGIPYISQIAKSILRDMTEEERVTFGKREYRIMNQDDIDFAIKSNEEYEAVQKKEKKKVKEEDLAPVPEPIIDGGCPPLNDIITMPLAPFTKTQMLMDCLSSTECANLVAHSAEYIAGRHRTKSIILHIVEDGEEVVNGDKTEMKFKRHWKDEDEMNEDNPMVVGFFEGVYVAFQQEMLAKDFLPR